MTESADKRYIKRLENNMVNKKEKEADFQAVVNIDAMEWMADMDLTDGGDFPMRNTKI